MLRNSNLGDFTPPVETYPQPMLNVLISPRLRSLFFLAFIFVFYGIAESAPKKVAERTGRGCSAPLWSGDGKLLAYTTLDLDELHVTELAISIRLQKFYRVANAKGVGRRFVFDPESEGLVYRRTAEALPSKPERLIVTPLSTLENRMITSNKESILGPYRIDDKIYYRSALDEPLTDLEGNARPDGPFLKRNALTVRNAAGDAVWQSPATFVVEGFELSPDGAWVAVVGRTSAATEVKIVEVAAGKSVDLGRGRWPSWSGDSNRLIFVVDKSELKYAELVVYDIPSGQRRSVQGITQFWPDEPALDPDGSRCAFVHDGEVYVTEVTGF